jgi:hypothetical protein
MTRMIQDQDDRHRPAETDDNPVAILLTCGNM